MTNSTMERTQMWVWKRNDAPQNVTGRSRIAMKKTPKESKESVDQFIDDEEEDSGWHPNQIQLLREQLKESTVNHREDNVETENESSDDTLDDTIPYQLSEEEEEDQGGENIENVNDEEGNETRDDILLENNVVNDEEEMERDSLDESDEESEDRQVTKRPERRRRRAPTKFTYDELGRPSQSSGDVKKITATNQTYTQLTPELPKVSLNLPLATSQH